MKLRLAAVIFVLLLLQIAGCHRTGRVKVHDWPPRPVDHFDEIVLRLTPPAPVNWDDRPGADGVQVQMNFFQVDKPLSVTVKGSLELALYEGRIKAAHLASARPLHTRTYSGSKLAGFAGKSAFGWGYAMRLAWHDRPPTGKIATLVARYRSRDGNVKASSPLYVPLGPQ